jgi:biotin transport system substrate-specific component
MKGQKTLKLYTVCATAVFAALISVGAFIKLPMPPVPITMQMLFTFLAVLLLGKRAGTLSVCLYILIGLLGLPVFSFGGGFNSFLQPSFGYIIGFALGNFFSGLVIEKFRMKTLKAYFSALIFNIFIVYVTGISYLCLIMTLYLDKELILSRILVDSFLVFIPGDLLKAFVASLVAVRVKPLIDRFNTGGK